MIIKIDWQYLGFLRPLFSVPVYQLALWKGSKNRAEIFVIWRVWYKGLFIRAKNTGNVSFWLSGGVYVMQSFRLNGCNVYETSPISDIISLWNIITAGTSNVMMTEVKRAISSVYTCLFVCVLKCFQVLVCLKVNWMFLMFIFTPSQRRPSASPKII